MPKPFNGKTVFSTNGAGEILDICMQRPKHESFFWGGGKLPIFGIGNDFLDLTPKHK